MSPSDLLIVNSEEGLLGRIGDEGQGEERNWIQVLNLQELKLLKTEQLSLIQLHLWDVSELPKSFQGVWILIAIRLVQGIST